MIALATLGKFNFQHIQYLEMWSGPTQKIIFPTITITKVKEKNIKIFVKKRFEEMIKIDPQQKKILEFDINVNGISPEELQYSLRLYSENFHFGFSGKLINDKVVFEIPELCNYVKHLDETMTMKFEIHDSKDKFYMKPFSENILIEKIVTVESTLKESKEPEISVTLKEKSKLDIFE